jgi:hypothetical protein
MAMTAKRDIEDLSKLFFQANESLLECLQNVSMEKYLIRDASPPPEPPSSIKALEKQMSALSIFDKIDDIEID